VEAQSVPQVSPATTNAPAVKVAPTVVARSANSRIWARITSQTNAAGKVSTVTNNAYTELGSGLCFLKDGEWVDANPTIKIVEDGASAKETQHKVHFAGNANKAGGAVHLVAPDGKVFDSRVYGLAYWDSVSGKSVLLAPLQDCQGTLVGTNRVIYTNAFKGVNADLEYVLTRAGLEQNVILRGPIPSPDSVRRIRRSISARWALGWGRRFRSRARVEQTGSTWGA
jgi:hypothetical protein